MKLIPSIRILLVLAILINTSLSILNENSDGIYLLVLSIFLVFEFSFLLFQTLEAIKELKNQHIRANYLRLFAIIYNSLTIAIVIWMLILSNSVFGLGYIAPFIILFSIQILIVDLKIFILSIRFKD
ncbi:hypothetical protein C9994_10430 [Marivirga lumbricoides]|uniref:Uncharacterized protein n=1 Tax=Marivirga lumbricoides TaxID=1046115 RepID=A0A2T4DPH6_9BACT|nr:hypothetical protein C9994_10430 [Marivirga lumbricoides]